ncbi:unnamed protein product [Prorocentrum cordatum]|uniref:Secreted protein n=1 Tax=Prorocentrum cordatum TaxID=2364126 RepID=A0ABN9QSA5_9DINO|nr:unnamed protein product [Polarella glacialis]
MPRVDRAMVLFGCWAGRRGTSGASAGLSAACEPVFASHPSGPVPSCQEWIVARILLIGQTGHLAGTPRCGRVFGAWADFCVSRGAARAIRRSPAVGRRRFGSVRAQQQRRLLLLQASVEGPAQCHSVANHGSLVYPLNSVSGVD